MGKQLRAVQPPVRRVRFIYFFCFITADTKLLEADIGSLNCGCPQAHAGSLIMCIAVPAGDADPDGDSISMHKGETHPSSHICTARSQRTPVKNQQDTLGSVLPPHQGLQLQGEQSQGLDNSSAPQTYGIFLA